MTKQHDFFVSEEQKNETYSSVSSFIVEIVKVIFWAVIIILPVRIFLFQPFFVQGASMEPNFENGEYLIINEIGYKQTDLNLGGNPIFSIKPFRELERGDVIVFRYPKDPKQYFIKRVIGLPGETISVSGGKIMIQNNKNPDGFYLDETTYIPKEMFVSGEVIRKLDDVHYFVMGDNRGASHDSRSWGPLHKDKIIGKVLLRAWPFTKADIY